MRKEAGLKLWTRSSIRSRKRQDPGCHEKAHEDEIKSEVLADEMVLGETDGYVKEWNINKEAVTMGVKKL